MKAAKTGIRGENEMQYLHYYNKMLIFNLRSFED